MIADVWHTSSLFDWLRMDCLDADGVLRGEAWPDAQSSAEREEGSMSTDIKLVRNIPRPHDASSTETKMGPCLQCLEQYVDV